MTYSSRHKFLVAVTGMVAALAVVGTADAEIVALRRGASNFQATNGDPIDLFQNGEISPVFANEIQGAPSFSGSDVVRGALGNGNITIINNVVDDAMLYGGADTDSTGIPAGGSNTWDEPFQFGNNYGTTPAVDLSAGGGGSNMSLLRFDVAAASGLEGGTINKAELRLFFDSGGGPSDGFGFRVADDQVGRITSRAWVEGNKDGQAPDQPIRDPLTGLITTPSNGSQGVSRTHPASSNTGGRQDINNVTGNRTRGFWFDPDGAFEADTSADPNPTGFLYRDFLPADFDSTAVIIQERDIDGNRTVATVISDSRGVVDGADLDRWEGNFGNPIPPVDGFQRSFPLGDADLDGDVDGSDFLTWQRNVGKAGVNIFGTPAASVDPVNGNKLDANGDSINHPDSGERRGWFGTENPGGDVTYQAPTWGDGNDYFNPDPVDYTGNPDDFPKLAIDGVEIYSPRQDGVGATNGFYPVSPTDGVSPGDGDVANEVNSLDSSSVGFGTDENFDYVFQPTEEAEFGDSGSSGGFDVWDITAIVQEWANGEENFGLYVKDNLRAFALSESIYGLDFTPVLFIDYTPAPAGATGVPEPSSIVLLSFVGLVSLTARRKRRANGLKFGQ